MIRLTVIIAMILINMSLCDAKKTRLKLPDKLEGDKEEYVSGSFCVSSDCKDCHEGYSLNQVVFSGYDKPSTSDKETLFITNNTDRILTGVSFYIEYIDNEGRQLHRELKNIKVEIPGGETRMVQFKSWDVQKSFRYKGSRKSRREAYSYTIKIDPVSIYLKF
ncbi:MAG: hypothetical protein NC201_05130 [Prevotella sp.]|nr:hypothetical protein [Bacteroides sp.]MCM1366614.1 hypothetical protein [Prevotella sp.]MCM1437289.1 hypothetical protein [Prevotella sp.]